MKLTFLGATQNVTGSRYLLETNEVKLLIDCGLYQEREYRGRNWEPFPVPPDSLDTVVLTHAHLDHCGLLPKLVREGFTGKIHCTEVTSEIARIVLLDSARLQEEDAEFKKKRHKRENRKGKYPEKPLYTVEDAEAVFSHFSESVYEKPVQVTKGIRVQFHDAGHILGSSMVEFVLNENGKERTLVFSGDVGRWDRPILEDPTLIEKADYITVESTYGDRLHKDTKDVDDKLVEIIDQTCKNGGNIVIPSFAIERAQELLYQLNQLVNAKRIPNLLVFLDSPMAVSVTKVFEAHPELFDEGMTEIVNKNLSPFNFSKLKLVRSKNESKAINYLKGTAIIIAGSGMCTGGRIKHHLVNNIAREESTILFVGYQAVGTLGRQILDGEKQVRILGANYPVKARIEKINGFSAHADRNELFRWLSGFKTKPKQLFVTHGEFKTAQYFARSVEEKMGWKTFVPSYKDETALD